jgi:hypothetical protein
MEEKAICFDMSNRPCRLINRVARNATGDKYTVPISDAATIPATIAPASVLIGAMAAYE